MRQEYAGGPEHDDRHEGTGRFARRPRPRPHGAARRGRHGGRTRVARSPGRRRGTAFASRWLPGQVTGLGQDAAKLSRARKRLPGTSFVHGEEQARFLAESRCVARDLSVVRAALRAGGEPSERQPRALEGGPSRLHAGRRVVAVRSPRA